MTVPHAFKTKMKRKLKKIGTVIGNILFYSLVALLVPVVLGFMGLGFLFRQLVRGPCGWRCPRNLLLG